MHSLVRSTLVPIPILDEAERLLQTYTLEEIFELNELTDTDVLTLLLKHQLVDIPDPKPIDL